MKAAQKSACAALLLLSAWSCSREDQPFRKEVVPVSGVIRIDGAAPGSAVQIQAHPMGGMDTEHPTASTAVSDPEGRFNFSTYETSDGLPPGEYRLTVSWLQFNVVSSSFGGPDKLNGRYSDLDRSELKVNVASGAPVDLGTLELTTE